MADALTRLSQEHRPYLVNLAYQMVGDIGDAEDIAQETFLRLAARDPGDIDDIRGWLTVVGSRLCLDHVRSARHRRVTPGDAERLEGRVALNQTADPDPADRITLDDQVHDALFEVLEKLSPAERVAFVLHDVFAVPFDEIARTVGRPAGTCRQLARRARTKIRTAKSAPAHDVTEVEHQLVTEKFIAACAGGDLSALTAVLAPEVWGSGTILAEPAPPPQVNYGPIDVATNLLRYLGGATLASGPVGRPVVLGFSGRRLFAVLVLTVRDGLIVKIEATADPSAR